MLLILHNQKLKEVSLTHLALLNECLHLAIGKSSGDDNGVLGSSSSLSETRHEDE